MSFAMGSSDSFAVTLALRAVATALVGLAGVALYRLYFHPLAKYPGPVLARLTGWYSVYHAYVGDVHLDMLVCHEKYGKVVRYGPNKLIFNTTEAVQDIYARQANVVKSTAYKAFETSATAHDLQSTREPKDHARKRRILAQGFSDSALRSLEGHVIAHADNFVKLLAEKVDGDAEQEDKQWTASKNMANWCNYVSFDYMTELVFGKSVRMLDKIDNRYIIDHIQFAAFRVGVCLQMPWLSQWSIDKFVAPTTRAHRNQYVNTSKQMAMDRMAVGTARQDLFSHILSAKDRETGKGFSEDELWGESTLLIIAGSDAISTAMAGCFFYLSRNPAAYRKLQEEVRAAFSTRDEIRLGSTLNSCSYLRACIDESMRMSPPVGAALWREVSTGGTRIDGNMVPQGCDVGVGIYSIQHNPEYYPDPYNYMPERWIAADEEQKAKPDSANPTRAAHQVFSIGPVGCVGKNLAYMELTLTLARVFYSLDFKPAKGSLAPVASAGYLKQYEKHAKEEYHLRDRFTSWKDGPSLAFRARDVPAQASAPAVSSEPCLSGALESTAWQRIGERYQDSWNSNGKYWWQKSGFALSAFLSHAEYSESAQSNVLDFFARVIAPRMGSIDASGAQVWKSFMTDDHCPIELSWDWKTGQGKPVIRFSIEPVGEHAGTARDPKNEAISAEFAKAVVKEIPLIDQQLFRHFLDYFEVQKNSSMPDDHQTQLFWAFDLSETDITGKAYFFPAYQARASNRTNMQVILEAVETESYCSTKDLSALYTFQQFATERKESPLEMDMLAIDMVEPSQSRLKIYFRRRETSFQSVCETMTLGGRLQDGNTKTGLANLRRLWNSLFGQEGVSDETDLPVVPHRTAGVLYYVEVRPGSKALKVKVYIPVRHYAKTDQQIVSSVSDYVRSANGKTGTSGYEKTMDQIFGQDVLSHGKGVQTYVGCSIEAKGDLRIVSYVNPRQGRGPTS